MNLRVSHEHPRAYDAFLVCVGLFGLLVAWFSFRFGGLMDVLGGLALLGEVLLVYGVCIEPRRLTVTTFRRDLVVQPATHLRLIWLSDMHAGGFRPLSWYERIAREVHALHPDLLVLGGDFVVDRVDVSSLALLQPLKNLEARMGKFFVLGNHDEMDRPQEVRIFLEQLGYRDATNGYRVLDREGRKIEIAGIDDHWFGDPRWTTRTSKDIPHVTLSHEPDILMDLKEGDTDLVLSGHTHGGQVRLPLIGPLWPVPARLGRLVDQGEKRIHGIPCIISNGLGESDGRMRLGCPPQIVVVELGI